MALYGRDFAAIYDEKWAWWAEKMWPFLQDKVLRHVPEGAHWLDLCCGAGALLRYVCDAGFSGVGLDASQHQLRHARCRAPAARLVRADVRSFRLGQTFDVITCMFDSLNYLLRARDLRGAFRNARRHLKDGGCFVFDMNTYAGLERDWRRTSTIREPSRLLIIESSFNPRRALGQCVVTGFVKSGRAYRRFEETHVERGYHAEEIESLLGDAGFRFRAYDGYTLSRPRKRSARLLYTCRPVGRRQ